jgi:hypothetical protein
MKTAKIEPNKSNNGWIVTIEESGKVEVTTIVMGTHEEATSVAEKFLSESTQKPQLLRD